MGFRQRKPVQVWCDSRSAISITKKPGNHKASKHIEIKYLFTRDFGGGRTPSCGILSGSKHGGRHSNQSTSYQTVYTTENQNWSKRVKDLLTAMHT
ncbi:Copia-like retrotransposable element [Phytophthora megakarya]|uniref:Copia-like retrotransposable element n=1 Tax=Phytophthora megakarya TaxID=4795 RepID=A0A225WWI7_9STRA|nr:Copia-like retrotransposable element [Phytophthora megakarya]